MRLQVREEPQLGCGEWRPVGHEFAIGLLGP
jgi:hypothetical protein